MNIFRSNILEYETMGCGLQVERSLQLEHGQISFYQKKAGGGRDFFKYRWADGLISC